MTLSSDDELYDAQGPNKVPQKLQLLKKKRGVIKGKLTLFVKYLDSLPSTLSADALIDLEMRTDRINYIFNDFEQCQDKIETICDDFDDQAVEREAFEDKFFKAVSTAKSYIGKVKPVENRDARRSNDGKSEHQDNIRYPEIILPTYGGDIKEWIEYRDCFDAIVNQSNLKPIQKYKYLRTSLTGSALEVITSLEYNEDSYDLAWKLLCERYNNPRILIGSHLRALFNIDTITNTSIALRGLADNISKHLRTIKALNVDIDNWDLLVIFFLSAKLEPVIQRQWEEKICSRELPTLQDFKSFLRTRADLLETLNANLPQVEIKPNHARKAFVSTAQPNKKGNPTNRCPNCMESHFINQCPRFLALSIEARIRTIKKLKLCLNCLGTNHLIANCRASRCRVCRGMHHTLTHDPTIKQRSHNPSDTTLYSSPLPNQLVHNQPNSEFEPRPKSNSGHNSTIINTSLVESNEASLLNKPVLLSTARVNIRGRNNQLHTFRILLDSGSQSNFLTQRAFERLNLPKHKIDMEVRGFNNSLTDIKYFCNLTLHSKNDNYSTDVSCFIVPTLCTLPEVNNLEKIIIPKRFKLADERFSEPGEIDLILGAEHFYNALCIGQYRLGAGLPLLQRTRYGWVISGKISNAPTQINKSVTCNLTTVDKGHNRLDSSLRDIVPSECVKLPDDEIRYCESTFQRHSRTTDGNFVVTIPLKEDLSSLGKSRHIAYKRLKSLESKFSRDPYFKDQYIKVMRELEQAGHMTKLLTKPDCQCNYLPHHAIINYNKQSTPIRIVYDASCPTDTGRSLNDIQYKGNIIQDDLVELLLRFRVHPFVVCADIEKMYRMIFLNESQRFLQCILWRENPNDPISVFVLNTLSFGLKCAPQIATRCLLQLAHENSSQFPEAAQAIMSSFYRDDLIYSGDCELKMAEIVNQIDSILRGANFKLKKWKSNSQVILNAVSNPPLNDTSITQNKNTLPLGGKSEKILGLAWSQDDDNLTFELKYNSVGDRLTKRKALSILLTAFDPLGLLQPVLITGKIFVQRLFEQKVGWDEPLPKSLADEFHSYCTSILTLNTVKIPRQTIIHNCIEIELHGFADSSKLLFGSNLYLRSIDKQGNILVRLLCSKSRIAKKETIPRLELRASVLLATLVKKVINTVKLPFSSINLWSDSTIVLAWINSKPSKLPVFMSNRIKEIHSITDRKDWRWVSSADNPADLITRGIAASALQNRSVWFSGPAWLSKPRAEWPIAEKSQTVVQTTETKPSLVCYTINESEPNPLMHKLFTKYSKDKKLTRIIAYVLRFIGNVCQRIINRNGALKYYTPTNNTIANGPLTALELNESLNKLMQISQMEAFPLEYKLLQQNKPIPKKSSILDLKPFMENKLIRVGGRLGNTNYANNKKHPPILHHKHALTKLILQNEHQRLLHAGPQLLLASAREWFWPIRGKTLANKIVRECVTCFRCNPKTTTPIMGNLPVARVTPSLPFSTTGIDYAGPFTVRDRRGRGYKCYKCYVGIFVCFSTKAVHIELISSLESQAFISALRRFIARRGKPETLVSDNATTFVGANNELSELFQFLNTYSNDVITFSANEGINWKFIPAYSPHMGGLHEAAVKSCKYHLKRVVGQALLTYEELSTYLIQIEGILNSRPLCPIPSSDFDDIPILTPSLFLIGRSTATLPDYDYQDIPTSRLNHYQQIQQMRQDFWRRWSRDYLGLLQQRTKWRAAKGPKLSVGTVVLIKDDKLPPCYWRLGRIAECHTGRDDVTRVATIKTQRGLIKRAFNNICVLPINNVD